MKVPITHKNSLRIKLSDYTYICYTKELFENYLCNHFRPHSAGALSDPQIPGTSRMAQRSNIGSGGLAESRSLEAIFDLLLSYPNSSGIWADLGGQVDLKATQFFLPVCVCVCAFVCFFCFPLAFAPSEEVPCCCVCFSLPCQGCGSWTAD